MSKNNLTKDSILEPGVLLIGDIENTEWNGCVWAKKYEYTCIFLNYYKDKTKNKYVNQYIDVFYFFGPNKNTKRSLNIQLFKKYEKENK